MKRITCIITAIMLLVLSTVSASALVNGIFVGSDDNGVNILNDLLRPGEEYWFPVLVAVDGAPPTNLTADDIGRNRLTVRVSKGATAVDSVSIEEKNGLAYLCIVPAGMGTVTRLEATLRLNYKTADSNQNLTVLPVLRVGYTNLPDDALTSLAPGEHLLTDNQNPIITTSQWTELARLNDHRAVTLAGSDWRYEVHVTGLSKRNLLATHEPDMELIKQLPNHQLHFFGFPGAPDFESPGKLTVDVSVIAEEYGHDFYLYRSAYGKLYPLKYEYDRDMLELTLRPTQLSRYVISDRRISLSDDRPTDSSAGGSSSDDTSNPADNPNTGGGGSSLMAAIAALVSLAGLGIMTCSKRHP